MMRELAPPPMAPGPAPNTENILFFLLKAQVSSFPPPGSSTRGPPPPLAKEPLCGFDGVEGSTGETITAFPVLTGLAVSHRFFLPPLREHGWFAVFPVPPPSSLAEEAMPFQGVRLPLFERLTSAAFFSRHGTLQYRLAVSFLFQELGTKGKPSPGPFPFISQPLNSFNPIAPFPYFFSVSRLT